VSWTDNGKIRIRIKCAKERCLNYGRRKEQVKKNQARADKTIDLSVNPAT
jgi:hypothetical protein